MTRAALLLAAALAGCAPAPRPATSGFDAAAWFGRARTSAVESFGGLAGDDPRVAAARAYSDTLDAAVGWSRACDSAWDPRAQRETVLSDPDGGPPTRGVYTVTDLGPAEHVVAVACSANPYQTYTVAVHLVGPRAALLRAPSVDFDGQPYGPPNASFTEPAFESGRRTFGAFDRATGDDCGIETRYRITGLGTAELVEARARRCDAARDGAQSLGEWPVVFPR